MVDRFYFLRHGQSRSNAVGQVAGALDSPLTAQGEAEARRARALLTGIEFAAIWSSPLRRAWRTAEIVAAGRPVVRCPALSERRWGVYEGRPLAARPGFFIDPPEGEGWTAFRTRVAGVLATLPAGGAVLLVSHSGVMRAVRAELGCGDPGARIGNAIPVAFEDTATGWREMPIPPRASESA